MARNRGWKREPARHSLASRGVRTSPRKAANRGRGVSPGPSKRAFIDEGVWGVECDLDGENALLWMDDRIGWKWSDNETGWDIFIMRMLKSPAVKDEFIARMEQEGLYYSKIKNLVADESYNLESAIYAFMGDNLLWHFGDTGDFEVEEIHEYAVGELGLTGDKVDEFENFFWHHQNMKIANFDEYQRSDGYKHVEKYLRGKFKAADSWEDLAEDIASDRTNDDLFDFRMQWYMSQVGPEEERIARLWLKQHPEDVTRKMRGRMALRNRGQRTLEDE